MKVNINYDKFFDSNSKTIDMTETLNVANNPSINTGLLDSIISNGTINNYSDGELYNFIGFIDESCKLSSYTNKEDIEKAITKMKRSKIASKTVEKYLEANPWLTY